MQREGRIVSPPKNVQMRDLTIWKPVSNTELDLPANLEKLGDIKDVPIEDLVNDIKNLQEKQKYEFPDNILMYALLGVIIVVIIALIYVIICKRKSTIRALMDKIHTSQRKTRKPEIPMLSREEMTRGMLSQVTCREISREEDYLERAPRPEAPEKKRRAPRPMEND